MSKSRFDLAKCILAAEPDAALGDPAALQRVTESLAKVTGALLATTLVRRGDTALTEAIATIAEMIESEARQTASMYLTLAGADHDSPPDSLN